MDVSDETSLVLDIEFAGVDRSPTRYGMLHVECDTVAGNSPQAGCSTVAMTISWERTMESSIGTLLALILGVAFIVLGYPLYKERIGPNDYYGLRIPQTHNNSDIWYPVNARSGKHFMIAGALLFFLGAVSTFIAATEDQQNIVMFLATVLALGGALYSGITGYLMARSMAARKRS